MNNQVQLPDGHDHIITIDLGQLQKILPHRYPMLMVEHVELHPAERRARGWKCVAAGEPFFPGHFPGQPVMPGVLILEAMLQTGGVMLRRLITPVPAQAMVSGLQKVKFRRPVLPGDLLVLDVCLRTLRSRAAVLAAQGTVRGQTVCQAEFTVSLTPELPPAPAPLDLPECDREPMLKNDEILKIIPHRYPMLMVDSVLDIVDGTLFALKNISVNEPFFQGHFPGNAIMPGTLLVESMAQAGAVYILSQSQYRGKLVYFMGVEKVRFRRPVRPGCRLLINAELSALRTRAGRARGKIFANGELAVEGDMSFAIAALT